MMLLFQVKISFYKCNRIYSFRFFTGRSDDAAETAALFFFFCAFSANPLFLGVPNAIFGVGISANLLACVSACSSLFLFNAFFMLACCELGMSLYVLNSLGCNKLICVELCS